MANKQKNDILEAISIDAPAKGEREDRVRTDKKVKKKDLVEDATIGFDGRYHSVRIPLRVSKAIKIKTGQKIEFKVITDKKTKGEVLRIRLKDGEG